MIVCVGLATRDTIYVVPNHPEPDGRVVASERVVAGGRAGMNHLRKPGTTNLLVYNGLAVSAQDC